MNLTLLSLSIKVSEFEFKFFIPLLALACMENIAASLQVVRAINCDALIG